MQGFMRLLERIHKTLAEALGEDLQGFARLWRGFARIHETLGEDSTRICDFGRGFVRLWERICKDS